MLWLFCITDIGFVDDVTFAFVVVVIRVERCDCAVICCVGCWWCVHCCLIVAVVCWLLFVDCYLIVVIVIWYIVLVVVLCLLLFVLVVVCWLLGVVCCCCCYCVTIVVVDDYLLLWLLVTVGYVVCCVRYWLLAMWLYFVTLGGWCWRDIVVCWLLLLPLGALTLRWCVTPIVLLCICCDLGVVDCCVVIVECVAYCWWLAIDVCWRYVMVRLLCYWWWRLLGCWRCCLFVVDVVLYCVTLTVVAIVVVRLWLFPFRYFVNGCLPVIVIVVVLTTLLLTLFGHCCRFTLRLFWCSIWLCCCWPSHLCCAVVLWHCYPMPVLRIVACVNWRSVLVVLFAIVVDVVGFRYWPTFYVVRLIVVVFDCWCRCGVVTLRFPFAGTLLFVVGVIYCRLLRLLLPIAVTVDVYYPLLHCRNGSALLLPQFYVLLFTALPLTWRCVDDVIVEHCCCLLRTGCCCCVIALLLTLQPRCCGIPDLTLFCCYCAGVFFPACWRRRCCCCCLIVVALSVILYRYRDCCYTLTAAVIVRGRCWQALHCSAFGGWLLLPVITLYVVCVCCVAVAHLRLFVVAFVYWRRYWYVVIVVDCLGGMRCLGGYMHWRCWLLLCYVSVTAVHCRVTLAFVVAGMVTFVTCLCVGAGCATWLLTVAATLLDPLTAVYDSVVSITVWSAGTLLCWRVWLPDIVDCAGWIYVRLGLRLVIDCCYEYGGWLRTGNCLPFVRALTLLLVDRITALAVCCRFTIERTPGPPSRGRWLRFVTVGVIVVVRLRCITVATLLRALPGWWCWCCGFVVYLLFMILVCSRLLDCCG